MTGQKGSVERLSTPRRPKAPRPLTDDETRTVRTVADVLVPGTGSRPAATDDPDFAAHLSRALDARVDAFESITRMLAALSGRAAPDVHHALRRLSESEPEAFQALSTVVAGAWLIGPATRERIGYPGQRAAPAPVDRGADEVSDGILDPVLARGPVFRPTPSQSRDRHCSPS
ncbi:hypothetical protein [Streptomyces phaeolivaceus]|uniref:hypothetical protein n=1 Tax=Streptomyces phaeolivaceus TaxID=2653200 RepID=UPI00186A105B|nr:hypothetical protein [Streptomyces phaeolivaceus]